MHCGPSDSSGPRSKWISLHGPQGPVSAIRQKLLSSPRSTSPQIAIRSGGQADLVAPDLAGDLVVLVRRGRQALGRDAHGLRQEVPREVDRLALEVVAEAPVAEHLEERVVAGRPADLLEVVVLAGDAQDALVVDRPGVVALLDPGQDVLELDHPRVREEERLVAGRDEAGARDRGVAALLEELDEAAPDLRRGQRRDPRIVIGGGRRHRPQWYRTGRCLPARRGGLELPPGPASAALALPWFARWTKRPPDAPDAGIRPVRVRIGPSRGPGDRQSPIRAVVARFSGPLVRPMDRRGRPRRPVPQTVGSTRRRGAAARSWGRRLAPLPDRRAGDRGTDERAHREAAGERRGPPIPLRVGRAPGDGPDQRLDRPAGRRGSPHDPTFGRRVGPRTATRVTMPIPTHARIEAARRW